MTDHEKNIPIFNSIATPGQDAAMRAVNEVQDALLRAVEVLKSHPQLDQRWVSIGNTQCELGIMALQRAIF